MRIAILDDYQNVALRLTDWTSIGADAEITVFNEHMADEATVATALADFDVVVIMRERTPFPASLFERLPNLKLLVSTSNRNRSVDLKAAASRGVIVSGTPNLSYPPANSPGP